MTSNETGDHFKEQALSMAANVDWRKKEENQGNIDDKHLEVQRAKEATRVRLAELGISTGTKVKINGISLEIGNYNKSNQCFNIKGEGYVSILTLEALWLAGQLEIE